MIALLSKLKGWAIYSAAAAVAVLAIYALVATASLFTGWGVGPGANSVVEVRVAPVLKDAVKVELPAPKVRVYAPSAKAKLKLPAPIVADSTKHVAASSEVRVRDDRVAATAVYDSGTGETAITVQKLPSPWLGRSYTGEIRADYGVVTGPGRKLEPIGRLTITKDALRIKDIRIGATASVDTRGEVFAGLSMSYRW